MGSMPEAIKLVADKVFVEVSQDALCKIDVAASPVKIWFAVKVVVPRPPREIVQVPDNTLEAFNDVNPLPFTVCVREVILDSLKPLN